jgi:hypothetical protein
MTIDTVKAIARSEMINKVQQFTLQTTDATPTLLFSIDTIGAEAGTIEYTVNGLSDDGTLALSTKRIFGYKNDGGTLGMSSEALILFSSDFSTADVAASINGLTLEVKVTGEASVINWSGSYEQNKLNVEVVLP